MGEAKDKQLRLLAAQAAPAEQVNLTAEQFMTHCTLTRSIQTLAQDAAQLDHIGQKVIAEALRGAAAHLDKEATKWVHSIRTGLIIAPAGSEPH